MSQTVQAILVHLIWQAVLVHACNIGCYDLPAHNKVFL